MRTRTLWLLPVALLLGACQFSRVSKPEAFGPGKALAVVTVYSTSKVELTHETPGIGMPGVIPSQYREELAPTSAFFSDTKATVLRVLGSSRHFRLVPEQAVLSSGAYAAARPDAPAMLGVRFVTPPGYKLLTDLPQVGAVARAAGAGGGLIVRIEHRCSWGERAGTVAGKVSVSVGAVDRAGQTIWMEHETAQADLLAAMGSGGVNVAALRASLVQAAERAARQILRDLDAQLRGG
ncbi:MAG TPA: hypothetical protein VFP50_07870 [Anaeromyxobacteraceae bacterium]|nr:hypothetical protein [Anaeromyxobacteraceae bacterium]